MTSISFGQPYFALLFLVWMALLLGARSCSKERNSWVERFTAGVVTTREPSLQLARSIALYGAFAFAIVASMQPRLPLESEDPAETLKQQWEEGEGEKLTTVQRRHHEVLFVVDSSASMEVPDLRGGVSRLTRATELIEEIVQRLDGQEVALIAFTSEPSLLIPPTHDYLFTRFRARRLTVNEGDVAGTDLMELFSFLRSNYLEKSIDKERTIILFTDGGDTRLERLEGEKRAEEEALLLNHLSPLIGTTIHVVGLGTPAGALIPGVTYQGEAVRSTLDESFLKKLASKGEGSYFFADHLSQFSIAAQVVEEIRSRDRIADSKEELSSGTMKRIRSATDRRFQPLYQWPIGGALLFLFLAITLPKRLPLTTTLFLIFVLPLSASPQIEGLEERLAKGETSSALHHNLGTLYLQEGRFSEAVIHLNQADLDQEKSRLNLAIAIHGKALEEEGEESVALLDRAHEVLSPMSDEQSYALKQQVRRELVRRKTRLDEQRVEALSSVEAAQLLQQEAESLRETALAIRGSENETEHALKRLAYEINSQSKLTQKLGEIDPLEAQTLKNRLGQAKEWLGEGEKEFAWEALTQARLSAASLEALSESKHPLERILRLPVKPGPEEALTREEVVRSLDRSLPTTGNQLEDDLGALLMESMRELPLRKQRCLFDEIQRNEGDALQAFRNEFNEEQREAVITKLRARATLLDDAGEKKRIQQVIAALESGDIDSALIAWSPDQFLKARYIELAEGGQALKGPLDQWRKQAREFSTTPTSQALLPIADDARKLLDLQLPEEWLETASRQFLQQGYERWESSEEPNDALKRAITQQESLRRLTEESREFEERSSLVSSLLTQLQLFPPEEAKKGEGSGQDKTDRRVSLVREGIKAALQAEKELAQLPSSALGSQQRAIDRWREALEDNSQDNQDQDEDGSSEENAQNQKEKEPVEKNLAPELVQLYQEMEQDDEPTESKEGKATRMGIRPW